MEAKVSIYYFPFVNSQPFPSECE